MKAVLLLLFFLINISTAFSEEKINITNGEWPPYLSEKLTNYGTASQIVTEAFLAVGIRVNYGFFPWKRSYKYAKEGKGEGKTWHGSVVWVHTEERAKSFDYSDVVIEDSEVLFYLKEKPLKWDSINDLTGKKIGGTAHTTYPLFEKAENDGKLVLQRAGNYDTLFNRLLSGRIDAIPQVKRVGQYFLQKNFVAEDQEKITFSPTVIQNSKYHLIFSKQLPENQKFLTLFNEGLVKLKKSGKYKKY
jgi:polar amino acid transport system substrate-binding protein